VTVWSRLEEKRENNLPIAVGACASADEASAAILPFRTRIDANRAEWNSRCWGEWRHVTASRARACVSPAGKTVIAIERKKRRVGARTGSLILEEDLQGEELELAVVRTIVHN